MNVNINGRPDGIVYGGFTSFVADGTATVIQPGFLSRHIRVLNETDLILFEKFPGQPDANCLKQIGTGVMTLDTASLIVQTTPGGIITLAAALCITGKTIRVALRG